jgi:DHA1 family bicyclomycin/chloramphenicol resistance-like MFS transporter
MAETSHVTPPVPHGRLVLLLGGLTAFAPLAIDMYLPAFPAIARELRVEVGAVEFTVSIFLAGMAVAQAFYGPVADRIGRRAPLLAGALIFAVAAVGCARAQSIGALLAWRGVMALGGGAGLVVTRAVVRDWFEARDAARMFAQLMLVMGAAPILAPLLGGQLLQLTGWRGIFAVLTVFGVLCAAAVVFLLPESLPAGRRAHGGLGEVLRGYGRMLTHRRFVGHAAAAACASGVLFAYITGAAAVFIGQYGVSPQKFGLVFGLNSLAIIGASQLNRRLLRRHSLRALLGGAYAVLAVTVLLLAVAGATGWGGLPALMVLLFAALAAVGSIFPNIAALAMEPYPHAAGSASAVLGTAQYVIGGAAGALVGLRHDGTAAPMTATIAVCGLLGWLALRTLAAEEN